jgi:phosphatidylethanolamine/phosphatidyl-N-methylethanolamine N-methyltransferase
MKTTLAFALGALRDLRRVGAIAPASHGLAAAVSDAASAAPGRIIVEAGAGTGAITGELLARLFGIKRFIVYERDPGYAKLLRQRYPWIETRNECASDVLRLLGGQTEPVTIVSSLPLLSMPKIEVRRCVSAFLAMLNAHPQSRLIHYTYLYPWKRPFALPPGNLRWRRQAFILGNLPPATVWVLENRAP